MQKKTFQPKSRINDIGISVHDSYSKDLFIAKTKSLGSHSVFPKKEKKKTPPKKLKLKK